VPSEPFTAIEQICHVRDIEIEGYQVRFQRTLHEPNPLLPSVDSERLAVERSYGTANVDDVFAALRIAREKTLALIANLTEAQLQPHCGVRRLWSADVA